MEDQSFLITYEDDDPRAIEYIQERLLELGCGFISGDDLLMILSLHLEYMALVGAAVQVVFEGEEENGEGKTDQPGAGE